MTQVKFLYGKEDIGVYGSVFAYFPEMNYYSEGNIGYGGVTKETWQDMKSCYAHIGQHSACHPDYANECKEAPINEYMPLLHELIGQGYNDLQIMNEHEIQCHRPPTKGEIKFGEGATHYRDFPLSVIGLKKGKAFWKDWFVAPDDGLRYYTT